MVLGFEKLLGQEKEWGSGLESIQSLGIFAPLREAINSYETYFRSCAEYSCLFSVIPSYADYSSSSALAATGVAWQAFCHL